METYIKPHVFKRLSQFSILGSSVQAELLPAALLLRPLAISMSICEQRGLLAPLGAAELYREGSCCWRCLSPTSLMIRGHFPVFPDQQVMGS
jgi:hypothetical protein